jgi:hypothetical protein
VTDGGQQPRRVPPNLNDPRLDIPTRSESPPWALPTWFTSTAGLLAGMAMVGSGTGLAAQGRKPGNARPAPQRRNISRRRAWLEAVGIWGLIFVLVVGGRLWAGSWVAAAEIEGAVLLALAGLFTICVVPVLIARVVRSGRRS